MDAESRHPSPARLLAPVALIVFGVAFLLIISSGGGGGSSDSGNPQNAAEKRDLGTTTGQHSTKTSTSTSTSTTKSTSKSVYVVKTGDTLGAIAETTGVPVERLQELNPGLDSFSLVAGQRIKLR
jgi:LysM repeat protein